MGPRGRIQLADGSIKSKLIAEAVREWLECQEDAEWVPLIKEDCAVWQAQGGKPWEGVEEELKPSS
jgi:hypothetical protein